MCVKFVGDSPEFFVVKIGGIRAGFSGVRFTESTEEEARLNNKFWAGTEKGSWFDQLLKGEKTTQPASATPDKHQGWLEDYLDD